MRGPHTWTDAESEVVRKGYSAGEKVTAMAHRLHLSYSQVIVQAKRLDLIHGSRKKSMSSTYQRKPTTTRTVEDGHGRLDDRNPQGPVALAIFDLYPRVQECEGKFFLDGRPATTFEVIKAGGHSLPE